MHRFRIAVYELVKMPGLVSGPIVVCRCTPSSLFYEEPSSGRRVLASGIRSPSRTQNSALESVSVQPLVYSPASPPETPYFSLAKLRVHYLEGVEGSSPFARFFVPSHTGWLCAAATSWMLFMGKTSSSADSLATLRRLFTAAERKVLDATTPRSLATAGEAHVKSLLRQARLLRDKWRDLLDKQTRKTKRAVKKTGPFKVTGSTTANERSRQKGDLLAAAVARVESRLADIRGAARLAAPSGPAERSAPASAARATRKKPARKPAVVRDVASVPVRAVSKKARRAGTLKAIESAGVQGLKTSPSTQRKVSAALKADRLKVKGITTRRAGHAQARVGRAQARRDGRNAMR